MLTIHPIPAFKDNYIWIGRENNSHHAFVVDPGDAEPVLHYLQKNHLTLDVILLTHKHKDHVGGVQALLQYFPRAIVYSHPVENIPNTTHFVREGDVIESIESFHVLEIPGHTLGHAAYLSQKKLFCGDTLFGAGCGRVFEGTPEMMLASLKKLSALPDDTLVYCGHEYTLANLKFALSLEPDNSDVLNRLNMTHDQLNSNQPSLPSTIGIEKKTNPFLRCHEPSIIFSIESHTQKKMVDEVNVFATMREMKNNWQ